jgi:EpsI family protein
MAQPASSRLQQCFLGLAILAVALVGLYGFFPYFAGYFDHKSSILSWLWDEWHGYQGDWEHGMLVPFLVLFLVYLDRKRLQAIEMRPSGWGLAVMAFSFFCFWLGYSVDIEYFGYASLQLLMAGLILWFLGKEMMKALLFPWAFLTFMFPMPFLDNMIAFPLRLLMSHSSHILLNLLGVANSQVGTAIVSTANPATGLAQGARFAIDVADPCSGIHSFFALIMIGALFAHLTLDRPWQKWILFLAAIPLAIAGNIARIILLTFATLWWGNEIAIGSPEHPSWIHEGAGFAVFIVALLGMVGCSQLLINLGRRFSSRSAPSPQISAPPKGQVISISFPLNRSLLVMALAIFTALFCIWTTPPTGQTVAGVTLTLPDYVGQWWGFDQSMSEAEKTLLPSDTEFERKEYDLAQGDKIVCSIVLSGAEKRSIHRPEICLPAQGWTLRSGQVIDVPLHSGHALKVMNLTITRPATTVTGQNIEVPAYYMYWFVGDKVTTPYHWERLWLTSWDRIVHHVNHRWAYVIVTSPITQGLKPDGKNGAETLEMLKAFIADVVPSFQKDGI